MADWADVRAAVADLPEAVEGTSRGWRVWKARTALFVWERPLGKKDLAELGAAAPTGDVLGVAVADVGVKEALLASEPEVFFTTSHFDGYPAVLVRLDRIPPQELRELVTEAWLAKAPKALVRRFTS